MTLNIWLQISSNLIVKDNVAPFVAVCPSVIPPADKRTDVTLSPENIQAFTDFDAELHGYPL